MSSTYWLIPSILGIILLAWLVKSEAKKLLVFTTFSKPDLFRYLPYVFNQASRHLIENPQGFIERHPIRIVHTLETIANSKDFKIRDQATQAIVDNIKLVAQFDEGAAAAALLTVINKSDPDSTTHSRALSMRPGVIDALANSDPVQAVLQAQRGIVIDDADGKLHDQSCDLVLKHLDQAFRAEPIVAAHSACNIARKTNDKTRESALWMLLSHMNLVTDADFESGHAAAEQAMLLGKIDTPLHQAALGMWEWHIQHILADNPAELIGKIFYGFGISTANALNKTNIYEHGFDFLARNPAVIADRPEEIVRVSLTIGLRTKPNTPLYKKTVEVWTAAIQELCKQNLRAAIQATSDAMTYTAPGSQFERQAQTAYCYLRKLDDDITAKAQAVFSPA